MSRFSFTTCFITVTGSSLVVFGWMGPAWVLLGLAIGRAWREYRVLPGTPLREREDN